MKIKSSKNPVSSIKEKSEAKKTTINYTGGSKPYEESMDYYPIGVTIKGSRIG